MLISKKEEKLQFNISFNNNKITWKKIALDILGVLLDNNLIWHYRIEKVRTNIV